jgi:hypothetical protein
MAAGVSPQTAVAPASLRKFLRLIVIPDPVLILSNSLRTCLFTSKHMYMVLARDPVDWRTVKEERPTLSPAANTNSLEDNLHGALQDSHAGRTGSGVKLHGAGPSSRSILC